MTSCFFLLCLHFSSSQGATHCCCSPSIPSSPSLHGSLFAPASCFSCILPLWVCCLHLTHPPQQYHCSCFLLHFFHIITATVIPAWFAQSLVLCACPFWIPGCWQCLFVHLAPPQGAPADKSGQDCFHLELAVHSQLSAGLLCNPDLLLDCLSRFQFLSSQHLLPYVGHLKTLNSSHCV